MDAIEKLDILIGKVDAAMNKESELAEQKLRETSLPYGMETGLYNKTLMEKDTDLPV